MLTRAWTYSTAYILAAPSAYATLVAASIATQMLEFPTHEVQVGHLEAGVNQQEYEG